MSAKRGAGRPIGPMVLQSVQTLDQLGESTYTQVWRAMGSHGDSSNVSKYLRRAVEYGLAETIGGELFVQARKYRVLPDWRLHLIAPPAEPEPETHRGAIYAARPARSVWDYASMVAGS